MATTISDGASDARPPRHGDGRVAPRAVRARGRRGADAAGPRRTWCGVPPRRCGERPASPGEPRGVRVRVTKRIPSQAGLGGGSSDAAAALVGLSRVWRLRLSPGEMPVAATAGSDVPFFLIGGTALGLGRGERVYPLVNRPRRHVVLVLARVRGLDRRRLPLAGRGAGAGSGRGPRIGPDLGARTLDTGPCPPKGQRPGRPVERRHPAIGAIRRRFTKAGAELARMSGSGSAVFGLFPSSVVCQAAARAVTCDRRQGPDSDALSSRFKPSPLSR